MSPNPAHEPDSAVPTLSVAAAVARLRPLMDRRPLLIVSDFDGTLSEVVPDPWAARIVPGARRALRRLAAVEGVHVALLSGRTTLDLAGRARVGGATYVGNHGVERGWLGRGRRAQGIVVTGPSPPAQLVAVAEMLASQVPLAIPEPWLVVEPKGATVAFHFRGAPDIDAAAGRVREAVDRLDPDERLERFSGRRALELRPPGAPAKGEALRGLLDEIQPRAALMLGDDRSDAAAFRVLRAARSDGELDGLAICVQAHAEVPQDVRDAADLVLASPVDAARLLGALARAVALPTLRAAPRPRVAPRRRRPS